MKHSGVYFGGFIKSDRVMHVQTLTMNTSNLNLKYIPRVAWSLGFVAPEIPEAHDLEVAANDQKVRL